MTLIADILKSKLPLPLHKPSYESRNKEEVYTKDALTSVLKVIHRNSPNQGKKEKKNG